LAASPRGTSTTARFEGFYRGLLGGLQFGTAILLTSAIIGAEPKAELPEPEIYLAAITTGFGILLGALGGRARARSYISRAARLPAG
jgi:hypothetical protein